MAEWGEEGLNFLSESTAFDKAASEMSMRLDKLPGGFYVDQGVQHAWALWISRAAIALLNDARLVPKDGLIRHANHVLKEARR